MIDDIQALAQATPQLRRLDRMHWPKLEVESLLLLPDLERLEWQFMDTETVGQQAVLAQLRERGVTIIDPYAGSLR
ncbi:MAG: hypothetical protein GEEBNDBF_01050 [bacterium]|nr:hypothetical protein [bacterium]